MGFTYERVADNPSDPELVSPSDTPEDETLLSQPPSTRHSLLKRTITYLQSTSKPLLFLQTLTILLALWGLTNLTTTLFHTVHSPPQTKTCYCGTSTTEALTLNCKFDSLAAAWLPPHCRDDELTAEFDHAGPGPNGTWTYYADDYHTIPMSIDEVALLADNQSARVQMTREWHVVHCLFYWRKMIRVRDRAAEGVMMEPSFDNEEHVRHCIGVVLGESWGTEARVALDT
ncbi:uncharacterized protein BO80DRAFT_136147 [Aspergillus ibericus CBS 121593]|uniref:Uncharacterized protein n=1 Tax=Aspergillus ibericus CBS 121593 TaxID=1448316 RepID=A0A395HCN8_9EURO|nr:hypothetical protein BO80DRAFT_136147 [Aspergillus ibericus CBS 121593]RAL05406.1 hypothetical protein BO80DRAFT_136147 [Aspergillus ibericus CBS 121593]